MNFSPPLEDIFSLLHFIDVDKNQGRETCVNDLVWQYLCQNYMGPECNITY
jgi:hypothetical protein